jgi:hypothetical protein
MNDEVTFEVLLCGEYENLLNACQSALEQWNGRSERIRETFQTGEETGRELLRLQARFAKAYTILQKHVERCGRCQLASRIGMDANRASAGLLAASPN